ncbi:MAG: LysR family transcriptional regulator [Sphingobium sp.]
MATDLPTNLLRTLVAIVETGSMLKATKRVHLTQAALSLRIKKLEELVRQPLFKRDSYKLTLTDAGHTLLPYARHMLALNDEALSALRQGEFVGTLRVGTVQDLADSIVRDLMARFRDRHPETQVHIEVGQTIPLVAKLEEGELDLVLGYGRSDDPRSVHRLSMRWTGSRELATRDVVPLVVPEHPSRTRDIAIRSLETSGRLYKIALEVSNIATMRTAVKANLGVCCGTGPFPTDTADDCTGLLPQLPNVGLIVHRAATLKNEQVEFADLAVEALRKL